MIRPSTPTTKFIKSLKCFVYYRDEDDEQEVGFSTLVANTVMLDKPGLLASHQILSHSHTLIQGLNSPATLCLGVAQHVAGRVATFFCDKMF